MKMDTQKTKIMRNSGDEIELTVNDININYNDEGPEDAPVLIFIHSFPFNKSMWNKQLASLKQNYRVIAYDIGGYGNVVIADEDFPAELFVRALIIFMDALKIEKAMLCGLSMGGYIALNAIESHPERFSALILNDAKFISDPPNQKKNA